MEIKLELIDIYPSITEIATQESLIIQFPQSEESSSSFNLADVINSKNEISIHVQAKQSQLLLLKNDIPLANGQFNVTNEAHWVSLISSTVETKRRTTNLAQNLLNCIKIKIKASVQSNVNDSTISKNTNTSTLNQKKYFTKLNTGHLSKRNLKPPLKQFNCPEKSSHNRSYEEKCHRQFLGELYVDTNNNSIIGMNNNSNLNPNSNPAVTSYTTKKSSNYSTNNSNSNVQQQQQQQQQNNNQIQKMNSSAKSKKKFKNPIIKTRNESPTPVVKKETKAVGMNRSTLTAEVKSLYHDNQNNNGGNQNQKENNNGTPVIKLNATVKHKNNNSSNSNCNSNNINEVQTCVKNLEANFNQTNLNNSNQGNLTEKNEKLEDVLNNSSQIDDNLLDDDEQNVQYEELKSDFSLLYTEEYFMMIPNDLLKLEIELIVEKMFEIINAYHSEFNINKNNHNKYKQLFVEYSEKFLQMNKKLLKFHQLKEEHQISKQSLNFINGHYSKAKDEMLEINKEEFNLFKKLLNIQDNNEENNNQNTIVNEVLNKKKVLIDIFSKLNETKRDAIEKAIPPEQIRLIEKIKLRYEKELEKERERKSELELEKERKRKRELEQEKEREREKEKEKDKRKDKENKIMASTPLKGINDPSNGNQMKNDKQCHPFSNREKGSKKVNQGDYSTENSNTSSNPKPHKAHGDGAKKKKISNETNKKNQN